MLEMASGCCVRSPMGTALAVREKTWEEARATQKWCACRSTWMDRGWSCGFMRHTRMEMAGRGVGSVQRKASRSHANATANQSPLLSASRLGWRQRQLGEGKPCS